jgi:hypothetical protein
MTLANNSSVLLVNNTFIKNSLKKNLIAIIQSFTFFENNYVASTYSQSTMNISFDITEGVIRENITI